MSWRQCGLHDMIVFHMTHLKIPLVSGFNGVPIADSVRPYNPDFVPLWHTYWFCVSDDWAGDDIWIVHRSR